MASTLRAQLPAQQVPTKYQELEVLLRKDASPPRPLPRRFTESAETSATRHRFKPS